MSAIGMLHGGSQLMLTLFGRVEAKRLHGLAAYTDLDALTFGAPRPGGPVQPFPERRDAVQQLVAETDEGILVERALEIQLSSSSWYALRAGLQVRVPDANSVRPLDGLM